MKERILNYIIPRVKKETTEDLAKCVEDSNKEYLDSANKMINNEGYTKYYCKKSLLLMIDIKNAEISHKKESATTMAPVLGYTALLTIFALGIMTKSIKSNNFILFILCGIIGLLIIITIISIWSLAKDKFDRIKNTKEIFLLKEAVEYIEKNIKE